MSLFATLQPVYDFNRQRTLALLDQIDQLPDPSAALAWRPGSGRAHIGWQLMHVGGSTPDDDVPPSDEIRRVLAEGREHLCDTLAAYGDNRLEEIPAALAERGLTVRQVMFILGWHEPHHQGQAHLTLNLFKAAKL